MLRSGSGRHTAQSLSRPRTSAGAPGSSRRCTSSPGPEMWRSSAMASAEDGEARDGCRVGVAVAAQADLPLAHEVAVRAAQDHGLRLVAEVDPGAEAGGVAQHEMAAAP